MKTKLTVNRSSLGQVLSVTVDFCDDDSTYSNTYYVSQRDNNQPSNVFCFDRNGNTISVCKGLEFKGSALTATPETLEKIIKQNLRVMKFRQQ